MESALRIRQSRKKTRVDFKAGILPLVLKSQFDVTNVHLPSSKARYPLSKSRNSSASTFPSLFHWKEIRQCQGIDILTAGFDGSTCRISRVIPGFFFPYFFSIRLDSRPESAGSSFKTMLNNMSLTHTCIQHKRFRFGFVFFLIYFEDLL
jgi:hypothetical protein